LADVYFGGFFLSGLWLCKARLYTAVGGGAVRMYCFLFLFVFGPFDH
jgi:hypothetical protein